MAVKPGNSDLQPFFALNSYKWYFIRLDDILIFGCKIGCKKENSLKISEFCGERGIRTPGTSRYAGFQDRCIRPLYHLSKLSPNYRFVIGFWSKSECKVRDNNWYHKIFRCFFSKKCMGSRMPAINNLRPLIAINERDRHQNSITT